MGGKESYPHQKNQGQQPWRTQNVEQASKANPGSKVNKKGWHGWYPVKQNKTQNESGGGWYKTLSGK